MRDHGHDVGVLLRGPAAQEFRARYLGEDACNCSWGCAMHSYLSASPRHFPRLGMEAAKIAASSLRRG